ncbi:MAG: hypothetical protein JSR24_01475 [Proteobacteria bacterium]|nr:hypothetical protein [Pseudomonadota bacterium]
MTAVDTLRQSLSAPADQGPAIEALWWLHKGDWNKAHECVQAHEGVPDCDSVHAHLHRVEGDLGNAGYWYRRAGRPVSKASLDEEWAALAAELLARR